jgi:hypothetical protein
LQYVRAGHAPALILLQIPRRAYDSTDSRFVITDFQGVITNAQNIAQKPDNRRKPFISAPILCQTPSQSQQDGTIS